MNYTCLIASFCLYLSFFCSCNPKQSGRNVSRKNQQQTAVVDSGEKNGPLPNFNICIENSASMDGYVATQSDFKNSVYGLITDIKARGLVNKLNLHYVNDSLCTVKPNALTQD